VVKVKGREVSLIRGYCGGSEKWRMLLELELVEETGDEGGGRRMRRFVDGSLWTSYWRHIRSIFPSSVAKQWWR